MAEKRVGLKEIAALAGMSVGNVSMVLSGRGDAARVSKASQQKILDAARALNYKPNVYAKRLRTDNSDHIIIAVFFAASANVNVIGSFFSGIYDLFSDDAFADSRPEMVLYPYARGKLRTLDPVIRQGCFHGAVFMGMSAEDFAYVESLTIPEPVVVFNRVSAVHHYVFTDSAGIGRAAAQLLIDGGARAPLLITGTHTGSESVQRMTGFIDECRRLGLEMPETDILTVSPGYDGGKEAALQISERRPAPDALFFSEGNMSPGILYRLLMRDAEMYRRLRIVSCSGDSGSVENALPGVSVIRMPTEEMSRDSVLLLLRAIRNPDMKQMNIMHKPVTVIKTV